MREPEKIEQMDREMHFLISSSAATEQKYVCLFCLKKLGIEAAPIVIVIGHSLNHHWKLRQQAPSFGTILAYLETTG